jgi:hypothetical protein
MMLRRCDKKQPAAKKTIRKTAPRLADAIGIRCARRDQTNGADRPHPDGVRLFFDAPLQASPLPAAACLRRLSRRTPPPPGTRREAWAPLRLFRALRRSVSFVTAKITRLNVLGTRGSLRTDGMVSSDLTMMLAAAFGCAFAGWVAISLSAHSRSLRRGRLLRFKSAKANEWRSY